MVITFFLSSTNGMLFMCKMVWCSKVPSRVAFFSWTTALGKILSIDNLQKRGMLILDWCYMCKKCRETVNSTPTSSYSLGPVDFGVLFIWLPLGYANERVIDMFATWQGSFGKHRKFTFWQAVPHCIMWCLWQEWNSRSFEGCEWNILEIKAFFLYTLLDWSAAFLSPPCFSLLHLFDHCTLN